MTTQRAPLPSDVQLPYLHKRLHSQIQQAHLHKALKTCEKILKLSPNSTAILLTKLSLLLHIDQYTTAFDLLDSIAAQPSAPPTAFEHAYCLYRLGREQEASDVLGRLDDVQVDGDGKEFLEAQLAYKAHDFSTASDIYTSLLARYPEDHPAHEDVVQNQTISASLADFLGNGYLTHLREAEDGLDGDLDALEEAIPNLPPKSVGESLVDVELASGESGKARKRRHRLPKGVVEGSDQPWQEDPERWIPLRSRTNQPLSVTQLSNRRSAGAKGAAKKKEGMGTGMTQGSYGPPPTSTPSTSGAGKKKKGRK